MRKQEKTVLIVAVGDLISTLIKFLLGVLTGSLALLADAWHSLGDLCTSLLVFLALFVDGRALRTIDRDASGSEDGARAGAETMSAARRAGRRGRRDAAEPPEKRTGDQEA